MLIYLHRNKINNKVYIGQTMQNDPNQRWKNGLGYQTCTYFNRAIQKYGWENFEHIILEDNITSQEELNKREEYYIKIYDSTNPEKGYNIKIGNSDISPNASPAGVKWMREHPEFGLARAQDMLRWQKNHPEEHRKMCLENQKKAAAARRRKVKCIETGIIYESATAAAREVSKTSQSKICMVCRGQRKTCGGYHWEYVEDE